MVGAVGAGRTSQHKVKKMATKNDIRSDYPTLSDEAYSDLLGAMAIIAGIVGAAEFSTDPNPAGREARGEHDVIPLLTRCDAAYRVRRDHDRRAAMVGVKRTLDDSIARGRTARDEAHKVVDEMTPAQKMLFGDMLSERLAKYDVLYVKVADLLPSFPSGTTIEQAVKYLQGELKCEISNRGDRKDPMLCVKVNLAPAAPAGVKVA
jgi:hypothetical protein